jgi:hypothetical protein
MKKVTAIVCALALLVLAGGAVGAGKYLITSPKQIKPGAVGLTNLSPAAVRALAGKRGPAGQAGPRGPSGAQGAGGPQGPQGAATRAGPGPKVRRVTRVRPGPRA